MAQTDAFEEEAATASDLAARIRAGDTGAEAAFVQRYVRGLTFILRRASGGQEIVEDICQEAFMIVLQRMRDDTLQEPAKLKAFLHRTAYQCLNDHQRKERRRKTDSSQDVIDRQATTRDSPYTATERFETALIVQRLIRELPVKRDRSLLFRFYVDEEDKARICSDLQITPAHFNRVIFRARQRFKEIAKEFFDSH